MGTRRVTKLESGRLHGVRPRKAGANARLGEHGLFAGVPVVRLTTEDGLSGFGPCWADREQAGALLGRPLEELLTPQGGVRSEARAFDYPLLDLAARAEGIPVYALAARLNGLPAPDSLRVPCYDTSLYFDDLHLSETDDAAALLAQEARQGYERGHRAFKLKVGRGARHLPLEEGTRRDVAIVRAVRQAVGPECPLLLDANNGLNLNLTKRLLLETAEVGIFWIEEPFHEDPVLYRDLRDWMAAQGLSVLVADGEGDASAHLLPWAHEGLIQVVQYDIFGHGFSRWLETGKLLDSWGVRSAPHHYGGLYGNYAAAHLAPALRGFTSAEWDEAEAPELDASGYRVEEGWLRVPSTPGFGLELKERAFLATVDRAGYTLET